jgi:hypothetical protein
LQAEGQRYFDPAFSSSAVRGWMRSNGVDLVRREKEEGLVFNGAPLAVAAKTGERANPRAFDTLSAQFVAQNADYMASLFLTNRTDADQAEGDNPLPTKLDCDHVYALKTREGAIALVEVLRDNPLSSRTDLRYKLVQSLKLTE